MDILNGGRKMNLKAIWAKMRERWTLWMALLFVLIGFLVNFIDPRYGVQMSMNGLVALAAMFVLALMVGVVIMLVDNQPNKGKELLKLSISAWIVLIVASLVTPLAEWITGRFL